MTTEELAALNKDITERTTKELAEMDAKSHAARAHEQSLLAEVAANANEVLSRLLNRKRSLVKKIAQRNGVTVSEQELTALRSADAVLGRIAEAYGQCNAHAGMPAWEAQNQAVESAVLNGSPLPIIRTRQEIEAAHGEACTILNELQRKHAARLRQLATPIAKRLADALRKEADALDEKDKAEAAEYDHEHTPNPRAQKLRAEAVAIEGMLGGARLAQMLPWVDL
jgi:hypothetical protein